MEGYRLFMKNMEGRQGGGVTLCVNDRLECMEVCLRMDSELTKTLWVWIKGRAGIGNIIVRVCYRLANQEDQADDALYR